ncbi:hypothetical protein SEPCBS119000_000052 [Sporothrix epigloea]|uniref:Uncharacterized protein n=1 Tax=Sporothrix epigloea TaxID=1892477 RepID=A0ABP0D6R1_9PEZI
MATPRVKRSFAGAASDPSQRQITNFFDRDLDHGSGHSSSTRSGCEQRLSSPLLPPSVQANLLAVGMRVRKSVPEGYKTSKLDGPPSARSMGASTTAYRPSSSLYSSHDIASPTPSFNATQRELTPFCGLHKVGGLAVQTFGDSEGGRPMFAASLFGGDNGLAEDAEPPSLTSSQETVSSTFSYDSSSLASTRKRVYDDEEEDDAQVDDETSVHQANYGRSFQVHEDTYVPMQGLSRASPFPFPSTPSHITGWLASGNAGRRALANPQRRRRGGMPCPSQPLAKQAAGSLYSLDQENAEIMADFDEADFLDAGVLAQGGDMQLGGL